MSSDVMIVCKEYTNDTNQLIKPANDGTPLPPIQRDNDKQAFCIDEASMGEPWTEFGKWFISRFCKAPDLIQILTGRTEHNWTLFTKVDFTAIKEALNNMEHAIKDEKKFLLYMKNLVGKHISTENW